MRKMRNMKNFILLSLGITSLFTLSVVAATLSLQLYTKTKSQSPELQNMAKADLVDSIAHPESDTAVQDERLLSISDSIKQGGVGNGELTNPSTKLYFEEIFNDGNVVVTDSDLPYFLYNLDSDQISEMFYDWELKTYSSEGVVFSKRTDSNSPTEDSQSYTVGIHDGHVAVYVTQNGETSLQEVTSTLVSPLPDNDKKRLEGGIEASSEDELIKLLQDYCS